MKAKWIVDEDSEWSDKYHAEIQSESIAYARQLAWRVNKYGVKTLSGLVTTIELRGDFICMSGYSSFGAGDKRLSGFGVWRRRLHECPICGGNSYSKPSGLYVEDAASVADFPQATEEEVECTCDEWAELARKYYGAIQRDGKTYEITTTQVPHYGLYTEKTPQTLKAFRIIWDNALKHDDEHAVVICNKCMGTELNIEQRLSVARKTLKAAKDSVAFWERELANAAAGRQHIGENLRRKRAAIRLERLRSLKASGIPSALRISAQASLLTTEN